MLFKLNNTSKFKERERKRVGEKREAERTEKTDRQTDRERKRERER